MPQVDGLLRHRGIVDTWDWGDYDPVTMTILTIKNKKA